MGKLHVEEFNPKGKKYYFTSCNKDFCYKNMHGTCSLDLTEDNASLITTGEYSMKNDVNYCRDIYKSIVNDGQKQIVYINSHKCGHYTFNDGQHRLCIASKKGFKIRTDVYQANDVCAVCHRENNIESSIKFAQDMVTENTHKKTIFQKILKIEPKNYYQDNLDNLKKKLSDYQIENEIDFREF